MSVCYNKLWKLLIDKNMNKTDLRLAAGITTGKLKIIDEVSTAKLSTLIVKLGQPFLIINALIGIEATPENIRSGELFAMEK